MSKELTLQQHMFLDEYFHLLRQNVSRREAGEAAKQYAGYADGTDYNTILRNMKDAIVERSQEELSLQLPQAVSQLGNVLEDPTQLGAKIILEASASIMDRTGLIRKTGSDISVKAPEGLIVLPPKLSENE